MSKPTSPNAASPHATGPGGTCLTRTDDLALAWRRGLTPPPRLSVPEWADRYRRLAPGTGRVAGRWQTARVEIGRGPMLAATEPGVRVLTLMTCTQLTKTAVVQNLIGYWIHLDPSPILLVEPKDSAAEEFMHEQISPMIRATPELRRLIGAGRAVMRRSDDTKTFKGFPGGFLKCTSAGAPDNLARRPIRRAIYDEVNKYVFTREGNPLRLGDERLGTYGSTALSVRACSPVDGEGLIEQSWDESDQRRASLACPLCAHRQVLEIFRHVWPAGPGAVADDDPARAAEAAITCEACGGVWHEGQRLQALASARWHQTRPYSCCGARRVPLEDYETAWRAGVADPVAAVWDWWAGPLWAVYRVRCPACGRWPVTNRHAGFQASKLYSPWEEDTPANVMTKFITARQVDEDLQTWWNTQAGLPWKPRAGKETKVEQLLARREVWAAEVPDGVALLTLGGDSQDDRVELEVIGWGRDEESWSIAYFVIPGDQEGPALWAEVEAVLTRVWHRADGRPFVIEAACLDTGGSHTQAVYEFCRPRLARLVWGIKGESERHGKRSPIWPVGPKLRRTKGAAKYRPVMIGTNAAKDLISSRLVKERPGPGTMHFPHDRDVNYFEQLTAERLVVLKEHGRTIRVWRPKQGRATEALDCRVYGLAALKGWLAQGRSLNQRALDVGARGDQPVVLAGTPAAERVAAARAEAPAPTPSATPEKSPARARKVGRSQYLQRLR